MSEIRLVAMSARDVERLSGIENQMRRFLDSEDASSGALKDAEDDAELLALLAAGFDAGITDDEATVGADLLDVYQQAFDAPLRMIALGLVTKLRTAFNQPVPEDSPDA